jgi:hypothetical protein
VIEYIIIFKDKNYKLRMRDILYEGDGIRIISARVPDEHDVYVGEIYCYLGRGILRECAELDTAGLIQRLKPVYWSFLNQVQESGVSVERLGWAFSKARITELERAVDYFRKENREARENLVELMESRDSQ